MPGKKGMKHYPKSIKEKAVRMHLEDGITIPAIKEALGIVTGRRIRKWCEIYRAYGVVELPPARPKGRPRKSERSAQEQIVQLKMEIEVLRNFLYEVTRR